jgi:hypothetical protein
LPTYSSPTTPLAVHWSPSTRRLPWRARFSAGWRRTTVIASSHPSKCRPNGRSPHDRQNLGTHRRRTSIIEGPAGHANWPKTALRQRRANAAVAHARNRKHGYRVDPVPTCRRLGGIKPRATEPTVIPICVMRCLTVRRYPHRSAPRSRRSGTVADRMICARPRLGAAALPGTPRSRSTYWRCVSVPRLWERRLARAVGCQPIWMEARTSSSAARSCGGLLGE